MPVPRWLPNAVSVLRILLVPVWVWAAEACRSAVAAGADAVATRSTATLVLLAIGLSDVADGWLARHFGLITRVGATLDAVADKLCQVVLVTWLCLRAPHDGDDAFTPLPVWFFVLLLARDLTMFTAYVVLRQRVGVVRVVHRFHGKLASLLLFVLLLAVTADVAGPWMLPGLVLIAVVVVASTAAYARDGVRQLRAEAAPG